MVEGGGDTGAIPGVGVIPDPTAAGPVWGAVCLLWCFPGLEDGDLQAGAGEGVGNPCGGLCQWLMKTCMSVHVCPLAL